MENYNVILDTNIIQYIGNKHVGSHIREYVSQFRTILYSDISVGELTAGAIRKDLEKTEELLSKMYPIVIDEDILVLSGNLHTIYSKSKIPYQHISLADRIVAASAISTDTTIYTADVNDFPRPFFQEIDEHVISYRYKNKSRFLVTQVLKPNYPVITEHINSL